METIPVPSCPVCGATGTLLYRGLRDALFGTQGLWTYRSCSTPCGTVWLDPIPRDLTRSYEFYHTHLDPPAPERRSAAQLLRALYRPIKHGYLQAQYGYRHNVGPKWWRILAPLAFLHPAGVDAIAGDAMFLAARGKGARLLEIGSGSGALLEKMRTQGWVVAGIEFDPACVAKAQAQGLTCYGSDVRDLGLTDKSFDAIYMGHVMEHLKEPRTLLLECHRLLASGGELVIVTPNAGGWGHRHYKRFWRGLETPRHLQLFTPRGLQQLTASTGFEVTQMRTTNRSAWYALGMSAAMRNVGKKATHNATMLSMISVRALVFEIFGRLLVLFRPELGEEIVLTARKNADH
ncbi:MAG: class I SAM-dependent methyltransferase [Chthoniobacterales bacterium]